MPRLQRPELLEHQVYLACLIDAAMLDGQRADPDDPRFGAPWTEEEMADAVGGHRTTVEGWRSRTKPHTPPNIVPLLKAFYGDTPKFAPLKYAMRVAWHRAKWGRDPEPPELPRHNIETRKFSDHAAVVALLVDQPESPNDNLVIPFNLRIHPDPRCRFGGRTVELGVTAAFFESDSEHWQPGQDSIFWTRDHPNIKSDGTRTGVELVGPLDVRGHIDGEPLAGVRTITLRPKRLGEDGPVTLSVLVPEDTFKVTPRDGANVSDTQTTVIEAIFSGAFPMDGRGRLVVASETIRPPRSKVPG